MESFVTTHSSQDQLVLRLPKDTDAEFIAAIYNAEIGAGVSHYDTRPHTAAERKEWLRNLELRQLPVVVAEFGGEVVGFGALTPFHGASGYRYTATTTMYVRSDLRQHGVGEAMGKHLLNRAIDLGIHSVLAGIAADNNACLNFIQKLGFKRVGVFREIGFRNGQWVDDICFQLAIASNKGEKV